VIASIFVLAATASAKTITVTSTADTIALDGKITLREAITAANTNLPSGDAPKGDAGLDVINFNIPGGGVQTIILTSDLPPIGDPITLDGTSQPGYAGTPLIELNGNHVADTGLFIYGGNSMVKGLVLNRFKGIAILLSTKGSNFVVNNYIGTNAGGSTALPNGTDGISIQASSGNNTIGGDTSTRNIISGNGGGGISVNSGSNNKIQGNYIGINAAGTSALGNGNSGVILGASSNNTTVGGSAALRNVISANTETGIYISGGANNIQGNYLGTNAAGTASLGNGGDGIRIFGANNVVGGVVAGARNIISGNSRGIELEGTGAIGNQVQGNFIGTNAAGSAALGNHFEGMYVSGPGNIIGGAASGAGNVISGNLNVGIYLTDSTTTGNTIQGNSIGTNVAGAALGNSDYGIRITGAPNTLIGGTVSGAGNIISANGGGVSIENASAIGCTIQGNFIGTNAAGTLVMGNSGYGVRIIDAPNTQVGGTVAAARNIISGNQRGVGIENASASGNIVQGNYIGVDISGNANFGNGSGIEVSGANCLIGGTDAGAGNLISGNLSDGVVVHGDVSGNKVQGNRIGTNAAGTAAIGNTGYGVHIGSPNTLVGGTAPGSQNLISGNGVGGIGIENASATGNVVQGNFIGTNVSGTAAVGNLGYGIRVVDAPNTIIGGATAAARNIISGNSRGLGIENASSAGDIVQGNYIGVDISGNVNLGNGSGVEVSGTNCFIGGTAAGAGNVISGNSGSGIAMHGSDATGNKIQGNLIGTNAAGTASIGNSGAGVRVGGPAVLIGGFTPGARNIIAGNFRGISLEGTASGSMVYGNYIGTDLNGSVELGNVNEGIIIYYSANNLIGGTVKGARNVVSGNARDGILIWGATAKGNLIQGNLVGTKADGVGLLPNGGAGVDILTAFDNSIGGTNPSARNIIAGNAYAGVLIQSGTGNGIQGNSIFKTTRLGIDMDRDDYIGLLTNDQSDPDLGANKRQNYPLLTSAVVAGGNTTILGTLNSTPGKQFRIEFFANSACNGSGFGEGETFIGFATVTTDGSGDAAITATLPVVPVGQFITATATSATNDTSEFSPCALVGGPNPGVLQFLSSFFLAEEQIPTVKVTVTRSSGMLGTVSVNYATSDGSATAPADYATTSGTLTFADGEVIKTFTIPIVNDGVPEQQETFNLTLSAPTGGATLGSFSTAQLYINNYDPKYPATSIADASVVEGNSGTVNLVFTVTMSAHTDAVTVGYQTDPGLAQDGLDYQAVSGTITFNPGETSKDILVPVIGDTLVEGDEMVFLRVTTLSAGYVLKGQGEGTIIDDDGVALFKFSSAASSVNENAGSLEVAVTRGGDTTTAVSVDYTTSDDTAVAGQDYTATSGTLSFAAGQTNGKFTVNLSDDVLAEGVEKLNLKLSNPSSGSSLGSPNTAVVTILDDEGIPALSVSDVTQAEGNSGTTSFTFNVSLSGQSGQSVTVNFGTVAGGTATLGNDYQPASTMLTFAPGETIKPVTVLVNGDTQDEPNKTFFVQLSSPTNATIAKAQGTGTIVNDDSVAAPTVQFSAVTYSVQEALTAITITVTRSGDTSGTTTVDYATGDGTATQKSDYELASGTLTFGPGETSASFQVLINEDSYVEGTETVSLTLSTPTGASLGAQSTAQLNISDDSPESVTNPNDDAQNFVYQQYHDLLNREPDAGGLAFWTGQITQCGNDLNCINTKRKDLSAAFYIELEFQETGYFVYRMQKATFGAQPSYVRFMADRSRIQAGPQLEQSKQAFAVEWVRRPEFKAAYPDAQPVDQFVNKLYDAAGLVGFSAERLQAIQDLMSNNKSRAQVLRDVIETPEFRTKEYNPSFVLMQYFGYLRRDAEQAGYQFWLNVLNSQLPQDTTGYHAMVCAFVTSDEYQDRFSGIHTHGNGECQ
jgi:parallel beta-helix repeat protein